MSDLKSQFKAAASGTPDVVVTPFHARRLETPEPLRTPYSEEAIEFAGKVLRGGFSHERTGRFSPSGIGGCARRSLFSFAGAPQVGEDPDNDDLKEHGKWGHLRWQVEGITDGWITEGRDAEVWTYDDHYNVGGSMDALLYDDSAFELKTVIGFKFSKIMGDGEPLAEHRMQFQTYWMTEEIEKGSIVYEERGTGQFHEFRLHADEALDRKVRRTLEELNNHVADDTLPPMRDDCEMRSGQVYRMCPFRKYCRSATRVTVPEAELMVANT